jgi:hypothetical protein
MSQQNVHAVRGVYERGGRATSAPASTCSTRGESGALPELRYFHVWSFRGATVIRLENFRERAEALESVGLGDGAAALDLPERPV